MVEDAPVVVVAENVGGNGKGGNGNGGLNPAPAGPLNMLFANGFTVK